MRFAIKRILIKYLYKNVLFKHVDTKSKYIYQLLTLFIFIRTT